MTAKRLVTIELTVVLIFIIAIATMWVFKVNIPYVAWGYDSIYDRSKPTFSIGIVEGDDPFHLTETKAIHNPVLTAADVTDEDAAFVADPFIVQGKGLWYMFFEVMNKKTNTGDIGVATSKDGIAWKYQKIVLDEPFHMSYPDVFYADGNYYMMPEVSVTKSIRLYKAVKFPYVWRYDSTILSGLPFTDSTIFQYNGKWWIISETNPHVFGTLRLYYADSIHGPWHEHPMSPIINGDPSLARPGGRVLFYDNKLYRIAQDDWPTYGKLIRIFKIDDLTTTTFAEHEKCGYPEIAAGGLRMSMKVPRWRINGFHQFDLHQVGKNRWIACIDGQSWASTTERVIKLTIPFTRKHHTY